MVSPQVERTKVLLALDKISEAYLIPAQTANFCPENPVSHMIQPLGSNPARDACSFALAASFLSVLRWWIGAPRG